jgi:CelD/BcsL family acetyltransferase involved in cellulose biosynthesis
MLQATRFQQSDGILQPLDADRASSNPDGLSQNRTLPRTTMLLDFKPITTLAALEAIESDWNALFERSGQPHQVFQSFNWCWHWCRHFLPETEGRRTRTSLAIMAGWRDGRLVMVWPLVRERIGPVTALKWLGEPVSQYGDIVVDAEAADLATLQAAWTAIAAAFRPDLAHLRKVRADGAVAPLIATTPAHSTARDEAPYLDLTSATGFDAYETRYSAHSRRNRRRLLRRLEEQGAVSIEVQATGRAAGELAAHAVDLNREWLDKRGLVSVALAKDATRDFMAAVAADLNRPVGCQVSALKLDGTPTSLQIGFKCKGHFALHVLVYALAHEKSRVGTLHLEALLRQCFAAGIARIDLLAPRADYKMDWADGTVVIEDFALPLTTKGTLYTRLYLGQLRRRLAAMAASGQHPWLARAVAMAGKLHRSAKA